MITLKEYSIEIKIHELNLLGRSRLLDISLARKSYWTYLNKIQKIPMKQIGFKFNRTQSTISSGIKSTCELIEINEEKIKRYTNILGIDNILSL